MYTEVAGGINTRTVGVYPVNAPIMNGESWYMHGSSQKQEGLRQVYMFTAAGNIAHNINLANIAGFTRIYGTFTDGTNWYPLPYVDPTAANQVGVKVTGTNIVITAGGSAPSITNGVAVLEWLAYV